MITLQKKISLFRMVPITGSLLLCLVFGLIFLSGCEVQILSSSTATPTATQTPQPTATLTPTPTATPAPLKAILVAPAEVAEDLRQEAEQITSELAQSSSFLFETQSSLDPVNLVDGVRVVVVLAPPANLPEIAASKPDIQFVVIQPTTDISPSGNLSVVRSDSQQQAFIAGYLTTIIAFDWRAAGLFSADDPQSELLEEGFNNGGSYFCGRCAPVYSPIVLFPLTAIIPSGEGAAIWQPVVDPLLQNYLYVIYLTKNTADADLLAYLSGYDMVFVGEDAPPEEYRSRWAASVVQDPLSPLADIWPDLIQGSGGKDIRASITITDVNSEYLSPGRLDLVNQTIQDLQSGLISAETPIYP